MTPRGVGFIGAGHLARSLVLGFIAAGMPAEQIWVTNFADDLKLDAFRQLGCHAVRDQARLCAATETLILAFKPKDAPDALSSLRTHITTAHLVISALAGIPLGFLEQVLGPDRRIIRAMPNTASGVRVSATAIAPGMHATAADIEVCRHLWQSVGKLWVIPEEQMHVATAVLGSGPAYVYLFMEALTAAAVQAGLPADIAPAVVQQTVFGAVTLAESSAETPARLRHQVSSPGGTTVAAIEVLEEAGLRPMVAAAVQRAAERSAEIAAQWAHSDAPGPR